MRSLLPAAILLVLAASPTAPATAATVTTQARVGLCEPRSCTPDRLEVRVAGEPGERNEVTIGPPGPDGTLLIEDAGASLRTQDPGCEARSEHTVLCRLQPGQVADVAVVLGDGDDRAALSLPAAVAGGDGADEVVLEAAASVAGGDAGDDRLTGGAGSQQLSGGTGSDALAGGAGADNLLDGGAGEADRFDGGPDADVVSYDRRTTAVAVDLDDQGPDGARGEGDVLVGVEGARGGAGDDRLVAGEADAVLEGDSGDDVLVGAAGDDELDGGFGDDRHDAGPGDDRVSGSFGDDRLLLGPGDDEATDGDGRNIVDAGPGDDVIAPGVTPRRVDLRCGAGTDTISFPLTVEPVPVDCERLTWSPWLDVAVALPARGPVALVSADCETRCFARVTLTAGDDTLAARTMVRRPGRMLRDVPLRLSARGRRVVAARGRVVARITVRLFDNGGLVVRRSARLVVRRR